MNFLAHLYLSGNNSQLLLGNFIADHVKGNQFKSFNQEIQKGILLHRSIDTFTDLHPIFRKSKRRLHPRYRHYDSVIIDIFFDYFLAKNWHNYSEIPLKLYTKAIYQLFANKSVELPIKSQQFIKYMIEYDILFNYQFKEGIQRVLNGMNKRTQGKSQMNLAIEDLETLESQFQEDFTAFFEELIDFSRGKQQEINAIGIIST